MSDNANTVLSSEHEPHEVRYDLYRGHPNMGLLPRVEMQQIMSDFLQGEEMMDSWGQCLNYGANAGSGRFRSALRSFLDKRTAGDDRGELPPSTPFGFENELFVTGGVSHGLELLCGVLTQPGDEVWVERPTYFLAPGIFKSNGLVVKSLPMMSDRSDRKEKRGGCIGQIDMERLTCMVEEEGMRPPKMIYIIPSYHNPTGRSMSVEERRTLATFASKHGVYLVADEVYHLLDWDQSSGDANTPSCTGKRPAGIVHFNDVSRNDSGCRDNEEVGCCISVSSFTKIWAPGIRLGWIDAPSFVVRKLENYGYIDSQGGVAPLMGRMMTHAIESGLLDRYLDKLKAEYAERHGLMCKMLEEEPRLTILAQDSPRAGGYFIWVAFPLEVNSADFLAYSLEHHGVKFMAGTRCDPFATDKGASGMAIQSCARLCFADLDRSELITAASTFIEAFRSFMTSIEYE
ncbi:hypothetical protein ACHAXT_013228 [Thalassiosira profunda]